MNFKNVCMTLLTSIYIVSVNAQSEPPQAAIQEQPIEEITVIGQRSMTALRMQIDRAEDRMFEIFNELNTDDLYDIHCRMEARGATRIKSKICNPVYYNIAEADATQLAFTGGGGTGLMMMQLARHNPVLGEKWKKFVHESPELVEAVVKHYELSEELKHQRRTYFGTDE